MAVAFLALDVAAQVWIHAVGYFASAWVLLVGLVVLPVVVAVTFVWRPAVGGSSATPGSDGSQGERKSVSWWSKFKRVMTQKTPMRYEVFRCPKCGGEVSRYLMVVGPGVYTRWTDREIVARCPIDGHRPWNGPAVRKMEGDKNFQ